MMLDSIEATKQMVERDLGVSFLPSRSVRREVQLGALSAVPLAEGHQVTLGTVAFVLRRQPRSEAVEEFLRLVPEITGTQHANVTLAIGPVDPA